MNDLSCEMITAYGKHTPRANALLDQYGMHFESDALDNFQLLVQNHFFMGVHAAFQHAILNVLILLIMAGILIAGPGIMIEMILKPHNSRMYDMFVTFGLCPSWLDRLSQVRI